MSAPVVYPQHLNPEVSPALQQEVAFFLKWGYLVIENAITADQLAQLRGATDEMHARGQREFYHDLLEEDDRFGFLLDNPPVLDRMKAVLGTCVQLHSATGRVTQPGLDEQNWHRDGGWPMDPAGTPYGTLPGQINCGYYLDPLTEENGGICIVPGSHRVPFRPPVGKVEFPDQKIVLAQPGQAVMFDGWLFHRGLANRSTAIRRVNLMCYQNAWMKPRSQHQGPRSDKLREGSPERQMLLGDIRKW
jgi:ectoine hydroxylase-related dioxygenase (phytanoyl-CoA dioxygenase family)